jgi:peptide/nickel transport system permease protein
VAFEPSSTVVRKRYSRLRTTVRQLLLSLGTLAVISFVTFGATNIRSPESTARNTLGRGATPEEIRVFIDARGLDAPVLQRYWTWIAGVGRGSFGISPITNRQVGAEVLPRFERTFLLVGLALLISIPLGIVIGAAMARRMGGVTDSSLLLGSIVLASIPDFALALLLVLVFGVKLDWLPVSSSAVSFHSDLRDVMLAYVMPVATLVLVATPYLARIARASVYETLQSGYVRAAVLSGLSPRRILWRHAMPNAAVPTVNAIAVSIIWLLSGTIVVENVFAFPGLGQFVVQSIGNNDAVSVQAAALLIGAMFVLVSVAADLLAVQLNPRFRSAQ